MLDFRAKPLRKSPFSRREQRGAMLAVFLVGMVVLAIRWSMEWNAAASASAPLDEQIDNRVPAAKARSEPGTFVSPGPEATKVVARPAFFPGVNSAHLAAVRDDTVFRAAEHDAWFHLLEILSKADRSALEQASTGKVSFVQLYEQPAAYRGELVTVEGTVHWAHRVQAPKNGYGIKSYHQVWLQPSGAAKFRMPIYCLELPPDFPTGQGLDEAVAVTGFFYKRWAYEAREGILTAPLVLAKTLVWQPEEQVAASAPEVTVLGVGVPAGWLIAAGLFAGLVTAFMLTRSRGPVTAASARAARPDELQALADNVSAPDVRESLKRLSERSETTP